MIGAILACTADPAEQPQGWTFEPLPMESYPPDVTDLATIGDSLVAADKSGLVVRYDLAGQRLGSFDLEAFDDDDCGLIAIAFDPDFAENGLFWYAMCTSETSSGVYRGTLDLDAFTLSDRVEVIVGEEPEADAPWHNVGWIGFDGEKRLLALFGDKTRSGNAQNTRNYLGSVVRIAPSRTPGVGGYTVPADNPLVGSPDQAPEILAWGFRSPWTGALDPTGRLWVGDVGSTEEGLEEVNLVEPGRNHGWARAEGPCLEDCEAYADPTFHWPHQGTHPYFEEDPDVSASNLRVVWVAPGPTGDAYGGRLAGRMLFGDTCLGFVRAAEVAPDGQIVSDTFLGHLHGVAAWAQVPDGSLVVSTLASCLSERDHESTLHRLVHR